MKHTKKEAENQLQIGLILALDKGLINEEMVKWVMKSVNRSKENQNVLYRSKRQKKIKKELNAET